MESTENQHIKLNIKEIRQSKEHDILLDPSNQKLDLLNSQSIAEIKSLMSLVVPTVVTFLLEYVPGLFSVILVGHINSPDRKVFIDGAALAVMYVNLSGISIGFGLATAMDTLCSQAYGAGRSNKLGEYFRTGCIVLSICFIPIFVANYFCTSVLIALGQDETVAHAAGLFARYTLPGLPFLFLYELMKKVLQAQNIAFPMAIVALLGNIINVGLGYLLVYHTSLGFIGAAVSRSIANFLFPLMMLPYLYFSKRYTCFIGENVSFREAFNGAGRFFALGVPGMLMLCFEWWAFELVALLSGLLPQGVIAIGANAVLINISSCSFMFFLGLSVAVNVRVGNHLGSGRYEIARISATWGCILAVVGASIAASLLMLSSHILPNLITSDLEIRKMAVNGIFIVALFQIADSVNATMQGVFRGSGRQLIGAKINFFAYYIVGIPLGCFTGFVMHEGINGFWAGMTAGLTLSCSLSMWIVFRSNWKELSEEAKLRIH